MRRVWAAEGLVNGYSCEGPFDCGYGLTEDGPPTLPLIADHSTHANLLVTQVRKAWMNALHWKSIDTYQVQHG